MTETSASRPKKRRLRKPLFLVLTVAIVLIAGLALFNRDDHEQADLPFIAGQIQGHKIWSATVREKEQRIEITTTDGRRFHGEWKNPGQEGEPVDALQEVQPAGGYTIEVPKTTWLLPGPLEIFAGAVLAALLVAASRRVRRFQKDR
ncbi:hypothetical protein GCM10027187_51450 [Streptosporangium sandarakinum]|uniref:Uncharacterized protein n=1 Tax=Streptosporangium sandarakinum TaxID=1260955 RepID=A0A852UUB3_9ACTN|nr:hypothetical protein [Streptosporangium sandarakinum]NYF40882.1 hypothetical protein [Streptosporangium sandarakinum]